MDMSMGTHVKECGFNFDVAPSLVQTKCPIYLLLNLRNAALRFRFFHLSSSVVGSMKAGNGPARG